MIKTKNVIKETGNMLIFGIGVNLPFWIYFLKVI